MWLLAAVAAGAQTNLIWHDASACGVEGRGWSEGLENYYDRLPVRAQEKVGSGIWNYSRDSAGMSVRFYSDTPEIQVRYRLKLEKISAFPDVSAVSTSGVDLCVQPTNTATGKFEWRWAGSNKPKTQDAKALGMKRYADAYDLMLREILSKTSK